MKTDSKTSTRRRTFGRLPDGSGVEAVTLQSASGMSATLLSYGATLQSVLVPDRDGRVDDVTAGFDTLDAYRTCSPYFGATIGRVANRIARGQFTLDGQVCRVPVNNGPNSLHGGAVGFDKRNWTIAAVIDGPVPGVDMTLTSADGDQGYPGTLDVIASWRLRDNRLSVEYSATTDRPTVVNLTNHAYWNLAGDGAPRGAMGHRLRIPADAFLPTDDNAIPTGEFRAVANSAFDFRTAKPIGAQVRDADDAQILIGRGYDHCFAVARARADDVRPVAWLNDPDSGRTLEIFSDQPAVQFYSGNFLDGSLVGKSGRSYRMGDAVALEPQMFPNTPNRPSFGSIRLDPGETYRHKIVWKFSVEFD